MDMKWAMSGLAEGFGWILEWGCHKEMKEPLKSSHVHRLNQ